MITYLVHAWDDNDNEWTMYAGDNLDQAKETILDEDCEEHGYEIQVWDGTEELGTISYDNLSQEFGYLHDECGERVAMPTTHVKALIQQIYSLLPAIKDAEDMEAGYKAVKDLLPYLHGDKEYRFYSDAIKYMELWIKY